MRPILCVIDLTKRSVSVVTVAAKMANAYNSSLKIIFPYRLIDSGYKGDASRLKLSLEDKAHSDFAVLKKEIDSLKAIPFDFKPEIGFAVNIISAHIRRNQVGMIVIGEGQASSMHDTNGTTLESLIKNLKVPFMIVPEEIDVEVLSH